MYLDDLIKSFSTYKELEIEIKNNILQNCYILYSNDNEILDTFSKLLSKLLVENNKYLLKDYIELKLNIQTFSKDEKMNVETAQEIIRASKMPPKLPNSNKVFILDFRKLPTVIVQNKLLKTIEEPEYRAKYIILTNNYYAILDTIKSRSRLVNIKSIQKKELLEFAKKQNIDISFLNKIYSICPELSDFIKVLKKEDTIRLKMKDLVIYTLNNLELHTFNSLLEKLKKETFNNINIYLDVFMLISKDILESRIKDTKSENEKEIRKHYTNKFYLKIQNSIIKALTNYRFNQTNDFIIRNFLLEVLEDRYKCKKL